MIGSTCDHEPCCCRHLNHESGRHVWLFWIGLIHYPAFFFCHYSDRTPENLLAPYSRCNMLACWHLKTECVCTLAASPDSIYHCRIVGSKSRENTGKSVLTAAEWINIFWHRWRDVVGRHFHLTGETGWQFSIQRESFFLCRCQAAVAVSGSSTRHRASCLFNE